MSVVDPILEQDVHRLVAHIRNKIPKLETIRLENEFEYASVPLCIIDAIFSLGVRYESTRRTVRQFCKTQGWQLSRTTNFAEPTTSDLICVLEPFSRRFEEANPFKNKQRTSPRSGITKAEAVYRFAQILHGFGIETLADALQKAKAPELKQAIKSVPGQSSGLSYSYFLILVGHRDVVKPDRMVRRFVSTAMGRQVSPDDSERLIIAACAALSREFPHLTAAALDNAIWKFQRGQPLHRLGLGPSRRRRGEGGPREAGG
jgi:hypothetical protein